MGLYQASRAFGQAFCFTSVKERGKEGLSPLSRVRRIAQPGSAFVWGTRGRRFKSCYADQLFLCCSFKVSRLGLVHRLCNGQLVNFYLWPLKIRLWLGLRRHRCPTLCPGCPHQYRRGNIAARLAGCRCRILTRLLGHLAMARPTANNTRRFYWDYAWLAHFWLY